MALTKESNQTAKLRVVPKFGDVAMINQLIHTKIWRQLYTGDIKAWFSVALWLFNIKVEMFASSVRHLLRLFHGRHTTGILTSLWTISMMLAFNSTSEVGIIVTFVPFFIPFVPVFMAGKTMHRLAFIDIHSQAFLVFIAVYSLFSLIHIILIYSEKGEISDHSKRGRSIIHILLNRFLPINEYLVQCIIEPVLIAVTGYLVITILQDHTFGVFLCLGAASLFLQEMLDGTFQYVYKKA